MSTTHYVNVNTYPRDNYRNVFVSQSLRFPECAAVGIFFVHVTVLL